MALPDIFGTSRSRYQFSLVENYLYLYHVDTYLVLPTQPQQFSESLAVNFQSENAIARTAPLYAYSNSGPRTVSFNLALHRDMLWDLNKSNARFLSSKHPIDELDDQDYVDVLLNHLQAMALPSYRAAEKMVDPPMLAIRFGNQLFIKGIVVGSVQTTSHLPILQNGKYAQTEVMFTVAEVDPYDAESVIAQGSLRGLNTTLERGPFNR